MFSKCRKVMAFHGSSSGFFMAGSHSMPSGSSNFSLPSSTSMPISVAAMPFAVDQVRQFLYRNNHYPKNLKNKILQSSDMTFRTAEIIEARGDSINVILF